MRVFEGTGWQSHSQPAQGVVPRFSSLTLRPLTAAGMMLTRHSALWDHATYEKDTPPGSVRLFDDELGVAAP
jgi:hypothetical protein